MAITDGQVTPEQAIGALMSQFGISHEKVNGDITNVTQAVQYVKQKMGSSNKWKKANAVGAKVAATGTAIGVGVLTMGVGTGVTAVLFGAGAGLVQGATADKISERTIGKGMRMVKGAFKRIKGTKGKHRREAAAVLSSYAFRYTNTRSASDRLGVLAYLTLSKLYGGTEYIDNAMRAITTSEDFEPIVFEMLRS